MGFLRIFLAIAVLVSHSTPLFGYFGLPAHVAVRAFFIISGFYIALALSQKYSSSPGTFWVARAIRLFPLFWISSAVALCFKTDFFRPFFDIPLWQEIALRAPNLTMLGAEVPFLIHYQEKTGWLLTFGVGAGITQESVRASGQMILVGPAWSLGLELYFYILAPFLCRLPSPGLALICAASFCLFLAMEHIRPWSAYFFLPANLWLFITGIISFRIFQSETFLRLFDRIPKRSHAPAAAGIILIFALRQYIPHFRNYELYLYLLLIILMPLLFKISASNGADRVLGDLSYPLYITHAPVLTFLGPASTTWMAVPACLIIAAACLAIIDRPIERFRRQLVSKRLAISFYPRRIERSPSD